MKNKDIVSIQVKHRFSASAERVYDTWLDPEKAAKFFFATATGQIVRVEIDARVGGQFTIVDRRFGEDVPHVGTFLELDRPRRIAFSYSVEKYSKDVSRVTIDIQPLEVGCELTVTQELDAEYAHFADRAAAGWSKMLETASFVVAAEAAETCGEGLAQHARILAKIPPLFVVLAETLEQHPSMLVAGDPNAAAEEAAYRELTRAFRQLAEQTAQTVERMASYRTLPMAAHDEAAFGPTHLQAFENFVDAQNDLLAALKVAAEQDHQMLMGMKAPG